MTTYPSHKLDHKLGAMGLTILETIGKNDFLVLGYDAAGQYYVPRSDRQRPELDAIRFNLRTVDKLLSWGYLYKAAITHELRAAPLGLTARDIERRRLNTEAKRLERERETRAEERRERNKPKSEYMALMEWNRSERGKAALVAELNAKAVKARADAERAERKAAYAAKKAGIILPRAKKVAHPLDEHSRELKRAERAAHRAAVAAAMTPEAIAQRKAEAATMAAAPKKVIS